MGHTPTHREQTMILSQDHKAAIVDATLTAWGAAPRNPHPNAVDFSNAPLSKLASLCGAATAGMRTNENPRVVQNRGIGSQDFGDTLAQAAQTFALKRYQLSARHLAFVGAIEAANFNAVEIADLSIGTALRQVGQGAEVTTGRVTMKNLSSAQLMSYASNLMFSREIVVNDQVDLIKTTLAALGTAAASTEGRLVYAALAANPTLSDGAPVFHSDFGNIQGAFSDTTLAAGLAALRKGMTGHDDDVCDLEAAHLVVAAGLEYAARKLAHDAGMSVTVTASDHLPAGTWYLLPDPEVQPVVSVIRLKGTKQPLRLEPYPTPIELDGFTIRAAADLGATMVSRHAVMGAA